ncbi:metallothiol transferase FosB [Paenisporosarcina quisquiliarum]|uniref:Metallothiol transferase FosB n=1 Tax=Paenisporosarcina quisquiliarum TaxID=365346 RepID=A0A9X3RE40_9BACL|nr:metallothiol transferase FosB [Paenisporosarcina quisquiliarum]MCZ8537764.1 metallothiol transferase FosB [Paenisporosarcina quisquiliarum]
MKINHLLFSVTDLESSISFYKKVFGAKLLLKGRKTAYFDLDGLWLALNEETDIPRNEIKESYTHMAFTIAEDEYEATLVRLNQLNVPILPGRERNERDKKSIYFEDLDGHKFEFHTGTMQDRLEYYKDEKEHVEFFG